MLLLPIMIELFPFFFFRQLCLYTSDSRHFFTLFLTDSLEKCQTKSFENECSTFYRARPIYTAVPDCLPNQWHTEKDTLR